MQARAKAAYAYYLALLQARRDADCAPAAPAPAVPAAASGGPVPPMDMSWVIRQQLQWRPDKALLSQDTGYGLKPGQTLPLMHSRPRPAPVKPSANEKSPDLSHCPRSPAIAAPSGLRY